MSNIYSLEPPTKGKVLLRTTFGDLEIELWPKEAPKAVRNFVQLCMEGYYDGTKFHRVIKDYIVQGGDPTNTGDGGASVYGEPFKDEFHSRLKFNRRGLVACANANAPNTNGSQFFITLDKADWLDKKNTIFGKIVGDTVYNLLRFNEVVVDEEDRPVDPPVLTGTEVVWNPFEDIVPRRDATAEKAKAEAARQATAAKARTQGRTKNLALLSFGDDAEADEEEEAGAGPAPKVRSAHDVLQDDRLAREVAVDADEVKRKVAAAQAALRAAVIKAKGGDPDGGDPDAPGSSAGRGRSAGEGEDDAAGTAGGSAGEGGDGRDFGRRMHDRMLEKRRAMGDAPKPRAREDSDDERRQSRRRSRSRSGSRSRSPPGPRSRSRSRSPVRKEDAKESKAHARERREAVERVRHEALRSGLTKIAAPQVLNVDLLKPGEATRQAAVARKKVAGGRDKDIMSRLAAFTSKLRSGGLEKEAPVPVQPRDEEPGPSADDADDAATAAGAGAAAASAEEEGAGPSSSAPAKDGKGYSGKVRGDIDHNAYMPAAWRVDDYLKDDFDDADDLASLRTHKLAFGKGHKDDMQRNHDDDYMVIDPLLGDLNRGKFSKAVQREKKRGMEWAGKAFS